MNTQEASNQQPVRPVTHPARLEGGPVEPLDAGNSSDATGDQDRVVGNSASAGSEPTREIYTPAERKYLLDLAAATVVCAATNGSMPGINAKEVPPKLAETKGCFVTLRMGAELRGCIGHIAPQEPLYQAVMDNAMSAASRDSRFTPVRADEAGRIQIEISVLTEPRPLAFASPEDLLGQLKPHADGVVLKIGSRSATFLPQVWEQLPDKIEFLNHLSRKAGHGPFAWQGKDTRVSIYHVEAFGTAG